MPLHRYLKSLVKPDGDSAGKKGQEDDDRGPFTMALFGLGRIGFIHLTNILINRRINLKYIVEENESIWEPTRKKLNLKGVTFLKSKANLIRSNRLILPKIWYKIRIAIRFSKTEEWKPFWLPLQLRLMKSSSLRG